MSGVKSSLPKFKFIDDIGHQDDPPAPKPRSGLVNPQQTFNANAYSAKNQLSANTEDEETYRSQIPTYHSYPVYQQRSSPFTHLMKRNNVDKLSEIFGSNQDFSKMNQIENLVASGARSASYAQQMGSQPKAQPSTKANVGVKFIDSSDTPRSSIYKQSNTPANKQQVYEAICEYFPDFIMTKTRIAGNYSVFKSIVRCLLCDGVRYIVAIVKNDSSPLGSNTPLEQLQWESFQTRYQDKDPDFETYKVQTFGYNRLSQTPLNDIIRLSRKIGNSLIYSCEKLPLQVEIIKEEKEYIADTGTVASALELFSTVLTFQTDY